EPALEELPGGYDPLAFLGAQHEARVDREHHRRHVRSRVRVGDAAAERAPIAHLHVADAFGDLGQDGEPLAQQLRLEDLTIGRERADPGPAAILCDPFELVQVADVDQPARLRQPELHHRDEAVAAGEDFGALIARERGEGVAQRRRAGVLEAGWDHWRPPFACWMAAHTRAGVSGLSMCLIPRGERASQTALTRQAADGMVPASPTPFTPSGFTGDGVTVCAVSTCGIWLALGTA